MAIFNSYVKLPGGIPFLESVLHRQLRGHDDVRTTKPQD